MITAQPLREAALKTLEPIVAIFLTAGRHQRSTWRYRQADGAKVYASEGCQSYAWTTARLSPPPRTRRCAKLLGRDIAHPR